VSGAPRPARPGDLGDADRADLVEFAAAARRSHDWAALADRLVRLRARGVPVAELSAVVGVGESRLRVVCRDHGPGPAAVGDLLAAAGWVDTATAAGAVLGVSVARLLGHTGRAGEDGVAVMAGWTRRWHGPSLPGWWAAQRPLTPDGNRYLHSVAGGLLRPGDAVFGTTNAAVLEAVIPSYTRLTPDERATARLQHVVVVHRQLGYELLAEHGDTLTSQEIDLLTAAPDQLPTDQVIWDAPVPFVMVDQLVVPYTAIPAVYATTAGPRGPAGPILSGLDRQRSGEADGLAGSECGARRAATRAGPGGVTRPVPQGTDRAAHAWAIGPHGAFGSANRRTELRAADLGAPESTHHGPPAELDHGRRGRRRGHRGRNTRS